MSNNAGIGYIIYARKSTESEERQVRSIGDQIRILTELANERGYRIVDVRQESKSAKVVGREVFDKVLQDIESGVAQGLIAWSPDRLSRNPIDSGKIVDLLDRKKLHEVVIPSQVFRITPNDKFMLGLLCSQAKLENDNRAENVIRGLHSKAQSGVYPGLAPTGYLNNKYAEKGNRTILKDSERFDIIKRMLKMVVSQKYTPMQVYRMATEEWKFRNKDGKKLGRSTWYKILTTTFYYGEYEYPLGSGKYYMGKHEPMITPEEYDMIQAILGRKGKPRPKSHVFAFTGLMKCGECGATITCEEKIKHQKNGNTHRYIYYHCTKRIKPDCTQGSIEEKELSKQILETLGGIKIPEEFHEWALQWLKKENEIEARENKTIHQVIEKEYKNTLDRIEELLNMRASKEITPEVYARKDAEAKAELAKLEKQRTNLDTKVHKWLHDADEKFTFAETAVEKFNSGGLEDKRYILSRLGSNLIVKDRKLHIDLQDTLSAIKSASGEAWKIRSAFEPQVNAVDKERMFALYSQSPVVLTLVDVVGTFYSDLISSNKIYSHNPSMFVHA